MDLSIIIPMFNEAENVETTLKRVEEVVASFRGSYEIIPVNDGSIDNTLEILREFRSRIRRLKSFPTQEIRAGKGIKNRI